MQRFRQNKPHYGVFRLKYTIDEYDHFLCCFFLAAESEFVNGCSPTRPDFAVQEVEIFAFL